MVYIDVDTQLDFLLPAGALYAPGAEKLHTNLARLTANAVRHDIPIISTMDAHGERDAEFSRYPPHCVAGTIGQKKIAVTLAGKSQYFVEKQTFDCFSNPRMDELVKQLAPEKFCVYGVVTDVCVRCAVDGLLERSAQVILVTDAILAFHEDAAEKAMAAWRAAGVKFVTTASLCG